jgi:hypothetical protein
MRTGWRKSWTGVAALLLTPVLLAGCETTGGTSTMPGQDPSPRPSASPSELPVAPESGATPPLSSTDLPTMRPPAKPPKTPTDLVPHDVVAGRVTRGGSGPCYGLITDDDTEYALHSTAGIRLVEGTYVRIRFASLTSSASCGPGRQVALLEATVLG